MEIVDFVGGKNNCKSGQKKLKKYIKFRMKVGSNLAKALRQTAEIATILCSFPYQEVESVSPSLGWGWPSDLFWAKNMEEVTCEF